MKKTVDLLRQAAFFLGFFSLLAVAGCAASGTQGTDPGMEEGAKDNVAGAPEAGESKTETAEFLPRGEKDILVFPVGSEVTVSPNMEGEKVLVLDFSPVVPRFGIPEIPSSRLVREVSLKPAGSRLVSQMQVTLNSRSQFLLSRPGPEEMQLMFARGADPSGEELSKPAKLETEDSFSEQKTPSEITGIDFFADEQGFIHIQVAGRGGLDFEPVKSPEDRIVLAFKNAKASSSVTKLYRLHKFGSKLKSAHVQNKDGSARIVISVKEKVPMQVATRGDNDLEFVFMSEAGSSVADSGEKGAKTVQNATAQDAELVRAKDGNKDEEDLFPGMKDEYSGQKISLDLQDADVEHVLRLIASVKDYNLVIDQSVQGSISLRLEEVPWEQALDLVLSQNNLVKIQKGNILRITTAEKREQELAQLRRSREAEMRARQSMKELEELQTEYIQVNYAKAAEMQPQVQEFLSERGKISNDPRTNMLIVSDVPSNLEKIKSVVNKLDQPERQVLIEARIVYATDEFSRSLGVNWGFLYPDQQYQQGQYSKGFRMNTDGVNTPSSVGGLDVVGSVAKIAGLDLFTLDAELQLGESQGFARTISSPRIITLNNEQAEITQGTQIATQTESESGGTTTEYVEAVLSLRVTPQITPNDKLILELEVSDDSPVGGGSDDINTKTASTKLIVDDGETLVLGGVRKLDRSNQESKVPGAGDVPILGWLFKNKYKSTTKNELLIFIRPKIM